MKEVDAGKAAIGVNSRLLRFLIAALVVAAWWGLGYILHANVSEYTLLGVPILLAFQCWIARRPLLTLWVRSGPPLRMDPRFFIFWILFALAPAYDLLVALEGMDFWSAATAFAAIIGAFGLAYALCALRGVKGWRIAFYFLVAVIIGLLPLIPTLVLPQFLHMRINGQAASTAMPTLATILQVGGRQFLLGPLGFVVEEVFFRGGLDTYLHRGEAGTGWLSAIFVSALWGLWHLPGSALTAPHLLSTIVSLLVSQIIIGVPLSLLWRKSGNLTFPDTTHALLEAVRSVLAAAA
jgi:Type II CAAX prenyl endopeptidase Rce1-like